MAWRKSREIVERIVVEGDLVLLTPTSLGNGDSEGLTDISLLLDEINGAALLTGTSIAGALRNYLRECERGFEKKENTDSICRKLFGWHEDDCTQSCLIIDDARSIDEEGRSKPPTTELRDGVRIDGKTRTAYIDKNGKGSKFDIELLEAGTTFKLRFELLISEEQEQNKLISAFATALQGFEKREGLESGEIHLGARKRRGYGECKVEGWRVKRFDLKTLSGLIDWLKNGATELPKENEQSISLAFSQALKDSPIEDYRKYFELDAWFALDGSMLIRSGSKLGIPDKAQPDAVHLRSKRGNDSKPIVSGTSFAGVLRHRAVRIVNTLKPDNDGRFVEEIFGVDMKDLEKRNETNDTKELPFASRLEVRETEIEKTNDLVQTRVKIDRFTGGAFEGALFDAAPVFSNGEQQAINLKLRLRNAKDCEIGLLLLLLKDLWTSDLAIGGESSIGRGRLKGRSACLRYKSSTNNWAMCLSENANTNLENKKIEITGDKDRTFLDSLVRKFNEQLKKEV